MHRGPGIVWSSCRAAVLSLVSYRYIHITMKEVLFLWVVQICELCLTFAQRTTQGKTQQLDLIGHFILRISGK